MKEFLLTVTISMLFSPAALADIGPDANEEGTITTPGLGSDPQLAACNCNAKIADGRAFIAPDFSTRIADDVLSPSKITNGKAQSVSM